LAASAGSRDRGRWYLAVTLALTLLPALAPPTIAVHETAAGVVLALALITQAPGTLRRNPVSCVVG
jgi:hypothetical protein